MPKLLKYSLVVITAACIGLLAALALISSSGLAAKLEGRTSCSWVGAACSSFIENYWSYRQTVRYQANLTLQVEGAGYVLVQTPERKFWTRIQGKDEDARAALAHLMAEHDWMAKYSPDQQVRKNDIVLDCGAHVGTFTSLALERGAAKVIAFEPAQESLECLRRTFRSEIAEGRVVLVPKAVWMNDDPIELTVSDLSSGMNSAVIGTGTTTRVLPATRIDTAVAALSLPRVDYIKMDIEGAEREALAGARGTLARYKPRLMVENYHLPDDPEVIPAVILSANPDYQIIAGPCLRMRDRFIPYVLYFE